MDLSKLPDAQRQELEQLQKQFQEHQAQQRKQQEASAAAAAAAVAVQQQPPAYDPSQIHHSYDPSQAYDQSYYYNYNYQDPSQQQQQQYDASYYQNYYPNPYQQQQQYTQQPETLVGTAVPSEQERNAGSGQVQDPYVHPVNLNPVPPGLNAAAAAAVAALSQLTQFAGTMGAAERASGGGYGPPMTGQGNFRPPPVGHPPPYNRGGGRRPFGGRGNFGFRPPPPFHGRGGRGGRGRGGRPSSSSSSQSHPLALEEPAAMKKIAWCELCRVDCTSKEILETHKNGKRHQKNLQRLQQVKDEKPPLASEMKQENEAANPNPNPNPNQNPNPNPKADADDEKKPWLKRKMKGGGRGGKRQRPTPGPPKPKVVIPLMCDLCNVKCDTQEVFDRHVGGKKHIAKLKRFQGHQAMFGPTAVQALYPPNPLSLSQQTQPPPPPQNPNPQLADAPLQFAPQPAQVSTHGLQ